MLKNTEAAKNMERLGFYKFNLCDRNILNQLKKLYSHEYEYNLCNIDMTVTHNQGEAEKAIRIHEKITSILDESIKQHFNKYKVIASHFAIKNANSNTSFQLHQDWSVVDETKYKNIQIWIPLDFSYPENGGMCFVAASHMFFNNIRSGSFGMPHIPIEEELHPYLSYLRLVPGECVVFYNKTFHGSFINSTPKKRIAVIVNIVEEQAQTQYYQLNEKNKIDVYRLDSSLLFNNLPELEKGLIPLEEKLFSNLENNYTDNSTIDSKVLISKIMDENTQKGRSSTYEHKLYHILKSEKLETEINELGFSIIPFIDIQKVKDFQSFFNEMFGVDRSQYQSSYSSVSELNPKKRSKIHQFTKNKIKEELDQYFQNYRLGITLFYSRRPDKNYFLDWHSDPSIVLNESVEPVYGIWCPLVDIDENSGGFLVVPGSHRISNKINGSFQTWGWGFEEERRMLDKYGVGLRMKAGEALIFDTRMVHASKPNLSDVERDNFVIRVLNNQLDMINMHYKGGAEGSLFIQNEEYFIDDTVQTHNTISEHGIEIGKYYVYKQLYNIDGITKMLENINLDSFIKTNPNRIFFSHR
jgi:ectoine hydroxylase-related dioxygenase (phytanoyl-CoA dioxygenase family)